VTEEERNRATLKNASFFIRKNNKRILGKLLEGRDVDGMGRVTISKP